MIHTNNSKDFKALTNVLEDKKKFTIREKLEIGLIVGAIVAVVSLIVYNVITYGIIVPVV